MDYLEYFNLREDPFRLTHDINYYYPSQSHSEAMASLNYMLDQKEGFFLATGEPGTGKTTLINVFLNSEGWKDRADIALILTPRLSPEEFLPAVLEDLNVNVIKTSKNETIRAFRDFLMESSMKGRRVIIIVDEAQNLPDDTLEELRLLSNLETEREKLLQIVLVGQPELKERLATDKLRQLNQRINVRAKLLPLKPEETADYIHYKIIKAGKGNASFENRAKKDIHRFSGGVPRLINIAASRALMAAYLEDNTVITHRHVMHAVNHLSDDSEMKIRKRPFNRRVALLTGVLACSVAAAVALRNNPGIIGPIPAGPCISRQSAAGPASVEPARKDRVKNDNLTIVVAADAAELVARVAGDAEVLAKVSKGTILDELDAFTDPDGVRWYKVRLADGMDGWMSGKAVRPGVDARTAGSLAP